MGALAVKRDYTAERGSTFDRTVTWYTLTEVSETFTGTGTQVLFTLTNPPARLTDGIPPTYSVYILINGFLLVVDPDRAAPYAIHALHLHFATAPVLGAEITVVYNYTTLVDLNNFTAKMQIRDKVGGTVLSDLTTENGKITITTPGEVRLLVDEAETSLWAAGNYVYDLELIDSQGYTVRLIEGKVTVKPNVTEPVA